VISFPVLDVQRSTIASSRVDYDTHGLIAFTKVYALLLSNNKENIVSWFLLLVVILPSRWSHIILYFFLFGFNFCVGFADKSCMFAYDRRTKWNCSDNINQFHHNLINKSMNWDTLHWYCSIFQDIISSSFEFDFFTPTLRKIEGDVKEQSTLLHPKIVKTCLLQPLYFPPSRVRSSICVHTASGKHLVALIVYRAGENGTHHLSTIVEIEIQCTSLGRLKFHHHSIGSREKTEYWFVISWLLYCVSSH